MSYIMYNTNQMAAFMADFMSDVKFQVRSHFSEGNWLINSISTTKEQVGFHIQYAIAGVLMLLLQAGITVMWYDLWNHFNKYLKSLV